MINLIPGCHFRASDEDQLIGMDLAEVEPESDLYDILHTDVPPIISRSGGRQSPPHNISAQNTMSEKSHDNNGQVV